MTRTRGWSLTSELRLGRIRGEDRDRQGPKPFPQRRGGVERAQAQEVEPVAPWHLRLRLPLRFAFPERGEARRQNTKSTVAGGAT